MPICPTHLPAGAAVPIAIATTIITTTAATTTTETIQSLSPKTIHNNPIPIAPKWNWSRDYSCGNSKSERPKCNINGNHNSNQNNCSYNKEQLLMG